MEAPASSSCPSKQPTDGSTTFDLEAGIKPMLPDPWTAFNFDQGVKPKLPDPCTAFKLEAKLPDPFKFEAGLKPKLPDPWTAFKLDAGVKPKLMLDACTKIKLEPKLPDARAEIKLEPNLPDACASKTTLEADNEPNKLPDACAEITIEAGIEPKPEPFEEDAPLLPPPPAAWDAAADDWETTPVSGSHPFFTTVLSRSHVQKNFQLTIPLRFQRHLPEERVPVVLLCRGRSWRTNYCGDLKFKKLDAAWRDFAVDNRLRVGDACVFELMGAETEAGARTVVFRVQVLRGGLPEEVTSKGATSDEPLVIVD